MIWWFILGIITVLWLMLTILRLVISSIKFEKPSLLQVAVAGLVLLACVWAYQAYMASWSIIRLLAVWCG